MPSPTSGSRYMLTTNLLWDNDRGHDGRAADLCYTQVALSLGYTLKHIRRVNFTHSRDESFYQLQLRRPLAVEAWRSSTE